MVYYKYLNKAKITHKENLLILTCNEMQFYVEVKKWLIDNAALVVKSIGNEQRIMYTMRRSGKI